MQDQGGFTVSFCPSFNSYSSDKLVDIAAKVTREEDEENEATRNQNDNESSSGDDDHNDFEFVLVRANPDDYSTINGSDEMEYPVFPLFNRDLLLDYENNKESQDHDDDVTSAIRLPLKKLFIDDRDQQSSSSSSTSSEADELEGILPGTYCVWAPPKSPSPARCKKSNSTGSSSKQRWRLRDLLHLRRSSSDGKESFIFYNPDHNNNSNITKKEGKLEKGKTVPAAAVSATAARTGKAKEKVSAHEVFYVRNKALKEGDKRRSYLPYRQGLVGFFANANGLGKTFHPF